MREVFTTGDAQGLGTRVADERAAREQLVKGWATYPAGAKAACAHPREYLPRRRGFNAPPPPARAATPDRRKDRVA